MDIPLDYYKIFCITAKEGSMTNAAEKLYITQPAVSMAIKTLEEKLGGKLFNRVPKGIILTSEGQVLYEYLSKGMNYFSQAEENYIKMLNLQKGEIKIGASDTICRYHLLEYLERFNIEYSDINIKVINRMSDRTNEMLQKGEIDIGFVNLPINTENNTKSDTKITECFELHDIVVGGSQYEQLSKKPIDLKALENHPLMLLEKGSSSRRFLENYAKLSDTKLMPLIELGSVDLQIRFARINLGLTIVAREYFDGMIDNVNLFEIPLNKPFPPRKIGMIISKNITLSHSANAFIDLFSQS